MWDWFLILLLMVLAAGFGAGSLVLSRVLGPHNPTPEKSAPYECGMPPVGNARERQSIRFYLIAMLFVVFDVEAASFYPWAVQMHALRIFGLLEMVAFVVVLAIGYAYVWKRGGFQWR